MVYILLPQHTHTHTHTNTYTLFPQNTQSHSGDGDKVRRKKSEEELTSHGKAPESTGLHLGVTHPLLTAVSRHLDPPRERAVGTRQHNVQVAARHAGHLAIPAGALVFAAGEESLPVLVDRAIEDRKSVV